MIQEGRAVFPVRIPRPRAGDIIRVTYAPYADRRDFVQCFTGICIAVRKRGMGSSFTLRNVIDGVAIERNFPTYWPGIKDAEIVGRRNVRGNKLYYLREKPLRDSTFGNALERPKQ